MQTFLDLYTQIHNLIGPVSDVIGALYVLAVALSGLLTLASKLWPAIGKAVPWLTAVSLDLSKARDWLDKRRGAKAALKSAAKTGIVLCFLGASSFSAQGCSLFKPSPGPVSCPPTAICERFEIAGAADLYLCADTPAALESKVKAARAKGLIPPSRVSQ
jgi:hypothetical protein